MNRERNYDTYIQWDTIWPLKKGEASAFCSNMDECGRQYAKWNKPDTHKNLCMILISYKI